MEGDGRLIKAIRERGQGGGTVGGGNRPGPRVSGSKDTDGNGIVDFGEFAQSMPEDDRQSRAKASLR